MRAFYRSKRREQLREGAGRDPGAGEGLQQTLSELVTNALNIGWGALKAQHDNPPHRRKDTRT